MSNRTLNVVRLQFVNKQTFLWVPLLVFGGAFVISFLIYAMIPVDEPKYGGGAQAPLWYFLVVGIMSLTMTFPFSQALSITRREFYLGSLAAASIGSAILASVFVLLGVTEQATDGFGVNGYFAYLPWVWEQDWWAAWIVYFMVAMLVFIVGFWAATVYKLWGVLGVTTVLVGLGLVLVVVAFVLTRAGAWQDVWEWLTTTGALNLALGAAVVAALLAAGSFLTLRRATP